MTSARVVHLLLVDADARPLGLLEPVEAPTPWWPDVEPVVQAVRERWGLDVQVLRVLSGHSRTAAANGAAEGGVVTYLAQVRDDARQAPLRPAPTGLADAALAAEPLRAPWAQPGGPRRIASWADEVLAARGTPRTGAVEQVKTWNLSSILRLPTDAGPVWCKSVPPFFAHEASVIEHVGRRHAALVPQVLAAEPSTGSMLLADVPGTDQWNAPHERLLEMVDTVVDLQWESVAQVGELRALGLPDWRGAALVAAVTALSRRADVRAELTGEQCGRLDALVDALPALERELEHSGLPDTLVHGDLHPGNWRHGAGGLVLLDWGDSGVGHPLLDGPAFLERVPGDRRGEVLEAWAARWRHHVPQADVERAAQLVRPLAALRQALIYQGFVDRIEPDERIYHRADVPHWLGEALAEASRIGLDQTL
ncbi:MAG TPA: phosphotransferase [Angustibacter sp.]|nr:phosphotransferase [Angustibacter sp.]